MSAMASRESFAVLAENSMPSPPASMLSSPKTFPTGVPPASTVSPALQKWLWRLPAAIWTAALLSIDW